MSASEKISIDSNIKKLAIIAGSGTLPRDLCRRVQRVSVECHVIGFKGYTNYITPDFWGQVGRASRIIQYLKDNDIQDIVFIGGIDKPNILSLRPDWVALKFFIQTWLRSFGDSNVLTAARQQLEAMGFTVHGIHKFLPELLMPQGDIGSTSVQNTTHETIALGVREALQLGHDDKGQAVIVNNGRVIAREGKRGTNRMIETYGSPGAVLVKMCKPQQDKDMDLPTIGPRTVQLCAAKKMDGIVGHAGHMLIAEQDKTVQLADKHRLFIHGYMTHEE